jgi:N utilization substance protein A
MNKQSKNILNTVDSVANLHHISKDFLVESLVQALKVALLDHLKEDAQVEVTYLNGSFSMTRSWLVVAVDELHFSARQITLPVAHSQGALHLQIGDTYTTELPQGLLGRISINAGKKVIEQLIRWENNKTLVEEINKLQTKVLSGTVIHRTLHKLIVALHYQNIEATIPVKELLPQDDYKVNGVIKTCLLEAFIDKRHNYQIVLSRTKKDLLYALLALEIPEIAAGIIQVKSIARVPGVRAKIAVSTTDPKIDPLGTCIGVKGRRVQAVSKEFHHEQLDIIKWSPNLIEYVKNAFSGITIINVVPDTLELHVNVIVKREDLYRAIGTRGINCQLVGSLIAQRVVIIAQDEWHGAMTSSPGASL